MSRRAQVLVLLLVVASFAGVVFVASASEPPASSEATAKIERGRYLVTLEAAATATRPKR